MAFFSLQVRQGRYAPLDSVDCYKNRKDNTFAYGIYKVFFIF